MTIYPDQVIEQPDSALKTGESGLARIVRACPLPVVCLWLILVGAGLMAVWRYAHLAGAIDAAPDQWPASSQISKAKETPTLIVFAHPKCPCTRASIRNLERFATRVQGKVALRLVFVLPAAAGDDWSTTDLYSMALRIPGMQIHFDRDGKESRLFNARTSGLALLFSGAGQLMFAGGLTSARGHEGDNDGVLALESLVLNQDSPISGTEVFGCPLQAPLPTAEEKDRS